MYKIFSETNKEEIENRTDQVLSLVEQLYDELDRLDELKALDAVGSDLKEAVGSFMGDNIDSYID